MPVNSPHPKYAEYIDRWMRCRDAMGGQDAVHARGDAYLPRLKEQSPQDYAAYVKRATFYNATWRTISGLVGMMLRRPPQLELPEATKPLLKDVTLSGTPFQMFLQEVCNEALGLGRLGVMVDYPTAPARADGAKLTRADAQLLQLRPTMQLYRAESIINWRCQYVGTSHLLTMVVLKEQHPIPVDEFQEKCEERYRVLDIDPAGNYRVRVFTCVNDKDVQIGGDVYPLMNNASLKYIPFVFIGPDGITTDPEDPPLIDLVNLNLSHYRTNADYEHAAHFVGLPTPVVTGYNEQIGPDGKPAKLYIGSGTAWVFSDPDAKATYLEFTGQGLTALKEMLAGKEQHMAVLGARMLEPQKKAAESPDSASIRRKGEESMLAAVAQSISLGISTALRWFVAWSGAAANDDVNCELNRDFYPVALDAQMLTALVSGWQSGAFSDQVLFENLQAGEIIDADTTIEEEQARLATQAPKLQGGGDPLPATQSPGHTVINIQRGAKKKTVTSPDGKKFTVTEE